MSKDTKFEIPHILWMCVYMKAFHETISGSCKIHNKKSTASYNAAPSTTGAGALWWTPKAMKSLSSARW